MTQERNTFLPGLLIAMAGAVLVFASAQTWLRLMVDIDADTEVVGLDGAGIPLGPSGDARSTMMVIAIAIAAAGVGLAITHHRPVGLVLRAGALLGGLVLAWQTLPYWQVVFGGSYEEVLKDRTDSFLGPFLDAAVDLTGGDPQLASGVFAAGAGFILLALGILVPGRRTRPAGRHPGLATTPDAGQPWYPAAPGHEPGAAPQSPHWGGPSPDVSPQHGYGHVSHPSGHGSEGGGWGGSHDHGSSWASDSSSSSAPDSGGGGGGSSDSGGGGGGSSD